MSLKAELETWASALESYDAEDFSKSIEQFGAIADTSKICWNIGIILATLGRHKEAVGKFEEAVSLDGFMTVGYHQKGVSNFMLGRYDQALKDFEDAFLYLRGNQTINYEQLGLDFRLYAAEVLFNCGLVKIYLGQTAAGMQDLREAQAQKQNEDHAVIDDAIRDQGRDYNVFSVPVGVLFRPAPAKLKNLAARDYMGKAVLVAASDVNEAYTTFTGITRLQRGQTPTGAPLDPSHPLSRSASVSAVQTTAAKALPPMTRMLRSSSDASLPLREDPRPTRTPFRNQSISSIPPRPMTTSPTPMNQGRGPALPRKPSIAGIRPVITLAPRVDTKVPRPTLQVEIDDDPLLQTPEDDQNALRLTQMYDDYYRSAGLDDDLPELPPIGGAKKLQVEAWSKKTPMGISPGGNDARGRSPAGKAPPSSFAASGGLKRWPSRAGSYVSRYDDDQSETGSTGDMLKIRVKVHIGPLTRGMSVVPEDTYDDFASALQSKFPELARGMLVRFKDDDGDMMTMQDDGDYEAAIDVARVHSNGRAEGKLEVWIE